VPRVNGKTGKKKGYGFGRGKRGTKQFGDGKKKKKLQQSWGEKGKKLWVIVRKGGEKRCDNVQERKKRNQKRKGGLVKKRRKKSRTQIAGKKTIILTLRERHSPPKPRGGGLECKYVSQNKKTTNQVFHTQGAKGKEKIVILGRRLSLNLGKGKTGIRKKNAVSPSIQGWARGGLGERKRIGKISTCVKERLSEKIEGEKGFRQSHWDLKLPEA